MEWNGGKKKKKIKLYVAYKRFTLDIMTHALKVKEWKNIYHVSESEKYKKAVVAIFTSTNRL